MDSVVAKQVSAATLRPDAVWMLMPRASVATPARYISILMAVWHQSIFSPFMMMSGRMLLPVLSVVNKKADLGRQKRVIGGTAVKAEKPTPRSVV